MPHVMPLRFAQADSRSAPVPPLPCPTASIREGQLQLRPLVVEAEVPRQVEQSAGHLTLELVVPRLGGELELVPLQTVPAMVGGVVRAVLVLPVEPHLV